MRLLDRLGSRYSMRDQGYYEGMASGAAVLLTYTTDQNKEKLPVDLIVKAAQAYQTNPVVWSCIAFRLQMLSEAVFKFRSLTDKHLYGNQDLQILEYPWPNGTTGDLIARMELDNSLAGNSFIWKADDDRLVRLPPSEVTIVSELVYQGDRTYRNPIGYAWDPNPLPPAGQRQPPQVFSIDEVAHWAPMPDPQANFRGQSWFRSVFNESDSDIGFTQYKTKFLDHGTPISAIRYSAKLRPDTIDYIIDRLNFKYGGTSGAWRPLVLDQGADPIMGKGLAELDFRNVQAGGEQRICAAASVPGILLGLKEADTGETYPQAMRRFADGTLRPLWRSMCSSLQKLVPNMSDQGVQLWYDTSDIAALQGAETERAQVSQVHGAAILTLIQAGFTRESVIAAVSSGDLSQLVPDPNAPTPGVQEREAVAVTDLGPPVTGPGSGNDANSTVVRPPRTGTPPGGGQVLTKPQTGATKTPMPGSIPTMPSALPGRQPSSNGKG